MAKFTPTPLTTLTNQQSAISQINTNLQNIASALENTLSRDGTAPNEMESSIDMNSNRIINLPEPLSLSEPLRLVDATTLNGDGTIVIVESLSDFLPENYGALGDGVNDDAPAIRQARDAAVANGGGTVRFAAGKTYLLASLETTNIDTFINPASHVAFVGAGPTSVIKVADGMNTGVGDPVEWLIFHPPNTTSTYTINNATFKDFTIDFNGANNSGFNYLNYGISIYHGDNFVVDGVRFLNNPGHQNITAGTGTSNVRIVNTVHENCGGVVNPSCTDHSSIFCYGTGYVISDNLLFNDTQSTAATGIEFGGIDGVVHDNVIVKYAKGSNIASLAALTPVCKNIKVCDNVYDQLSWGITLWNDSGSTMTDIDISNNTFTESARLTAVDFFDFDNQVTAAGVNGVLFQNNTFRSSVAAGSATSNPTLRLGRGVNQQIIGNRFYGGLGPAIQGGTFSAATSFVIKGNKIIDAGQTSTAAGRKGLLLNSAVAIASFEIGDNSVMNVASAYMTDAYDISLVNAVKGNFYPNNTYNTASASALTGYPASMPSANNKGILYGQGTGYPFTSTASANSSILVTDGSGTPSLSTTLPAHTLGGTISGGGNQINNVIIGNTSPLAGSFTSIAGTSETITSTSANALVVGPNGTTNPTLKVDCSPASAISGLSISGGATGNNFVDLQAISSDADENLRFSSKGSGSQLSFRVGTTTALLANSSGVFAGLPLFTASTGGLGYSAGAGGTVTQITSKSTGVTLNAPTGQITMHNAALAAGATVAFTLTNSSIAATDVIIVNIKSGATVGAYLASVDVVGGGNCGISLRNLSGGSLGEAVVLQFAVIKGVNS